MLQRPRQCWTPLPKPPLLLLLLLLPLLSPLPPPPLPLQRHLQKSGKRDAWSWSGDVDRQSMLYLERLRWRSAWSRLLALDHLAPYSFTKIDLYIDGTIDWLVHLTFPLIQRSWGWGSKKGKAVTLEIAHSIPEDGGARSCQTKLASVCFDTSQLMRAAIHHNSDPAWALTLLDEGVQRNQAMLLNDCRNTKLRGGLNHALSSGWSSHFCSSTDGSKSITPGLSCAKTLHIPCWWGQKHLQIVTGYKRTYCWGWGPTHNKRWEWRFANVCQAFAMFQDFTILLDMFGCVWTCCSAFRRMRVR